MFLPRGEFLTRQSRTCQLVLNSGRVLYWIWMEFLSCFTPLPGFSMLSDNAASRCRICHPQRHPTTLKFEAAVQHDSGFKTSILCQEYIQPCRPWRLKCRVKLQVLRRNTSASECEMTRSQLSGQKFRPLSGRPPVMILSLIHI